MVASRVQRRHERLGEFLGIELADDIALILAVPISANPLEHDSDLHVILSQFTRHCVCRHLVDIGVLKERRFELVRRNVLTTAA